NVEHVLGCRDFVASMLANTRDLTVLATSREPLRISAEQLYPVPTMPVPPDDAPLEVLAHSDAITLFVDRMRAREPSFVLDDSNAEAVAEICRRLDGLPLAIELAAARAAQIGPVELVERLRADLGALGGGPDDAPERHRTLEAAVAWSYEALDTHLRAIFRRLSVFVDAFSDD